MNLVFFNYRFADEVLNSNLNVRRELLGALQGLDLPLEGVTRPGLNKLIQEKLCSLGWESQVPVFGLPGRETKLDFLKQRVGIEVQFGHSSFIGIDLLKLQVASFAVLDRIDVGVYVAATKRFAKDMASVDRNWKGSLVYEKIERYLPTLRSAIHVPILVVGLTL